MSIELELRQVALTGGLIDAVGHMLLQEDDILEDERVHVGSAEAPVSVLRSTDDRLTPHVEARIDKDGAAGLREEGTHQPREARVSRIVDGLQAGAVVDVCYGRDGRSAHVD